MERQVVAVRLIRSNGEAYRYKKEELKHFHLGSIDYTIETKANRKIVETMYANEVNVFLSGENAKIVPPPFEKRDIKWVVVEFFGGDEDCFHIKWRDDAQPYNANQTYSASKNHKGFFLCIDKEDDVTDAFQYYL